MKVYGVHYGCMYEGMWLLSLHATLEGVKASMEAKMKLELFESDMWEQQDWEKIEDPRNLETDMVEYWEYRTTSIMIKTHEVKE